MYESLYLVESYQVAGEPLRSVRLSRTAAIRERYDPQELAIRGADVRIHLLTEGGDVEETYLLTERPQEPGLYVPSAGHIVQSLRTYRLEIQAENDEISAQTTIPEAFDIVSLNADTVVYRSDRQLEFSFTTSRYPGRQTVYIFTSEAMDRRADMLTPFWANLYEDGDVTLDELRMFNSPPLNEANYDVNPDGSISVPMPWLMVAFYGAQRVNANAIDDNMLDFVRSHQVQQGGSTLSPGEIPNILDHINGGTGIFGSYASVTREVYVLREVD